MTVSGLILTSIVVLLGGDGGQQGDMAQLQGVWKLVRSEQDGEVLNHVGVLTIEPGKFTAKLGELVFHGTFKLHLDKNPKAIDVQDTDGPVKDEVRHGIYRVEGDNLTLCLAPVGHERPRSFATIKGTGISVDTYKRRSK